MTYTQDGAVSAVAGGPKDPTIQPGQFEGEGEGGLRVVDRGDAGPLTGDAARGAKEEKK